MGMNLSRSRITPSKNSKPAKRGRRLPKTCCRCEIMPNCARPSKVIAFLEPLSPLAQRCQKIEKSDNNLRYPSFEVRMLHFQQAFEPRAKARNRYDNALPTSTDIVSLAHPTSKETAYINASRFGRMIISQAPFIRGKIDTCADFWMLAFEQGSQNCLFDRSVCHQYKRM